MQTANSILPRVRYTRGRAYDIKHLQGFVKGNHTVPKMAGKAANQFIHNIGQMDMEGQTSKIFNGLREAGYPADTIRLSTEREYVRLSQDDFCWDFSWRHNLQNLRYAWLDEHITFQPSFLPVASQLVGNTAHASSYPFSKLQQLEKLLAHLERQMPQQVIFSPILQQIRLSLDEHITCVIDPACVKMKSNATEDQLAYGGGASLESMFNYWRDIFQVILDCV